MLTKKPIEDADPVLLEEAQDFYNFINEVILPFEPKGFKAHSAFHRNLILTACRPMSVTAAPRNHLKSTILARYRPLYRLVEPSSQHRRTSKEKDAVDILLLSETSRFAQEHLAWIKHHIEHNHVIHERYGRFKAQEAERLPWNQDEIQLTNGNRIVAIGYGGQVRGRHPTDIIVDDLESLNNIATEETLSKLKEWFYRVLMFARDPDTSLTYIGTVVAQNSLMTELLSKAEFNPRIWKALNTDAKGNQYSIWPERWPVSMLLKLRSSLGSHRFEAELQNNPIGPQDMIILPEWVKRHTEAELSSIHPVRRFIAVDPAYTTETWGNYSAILVMDQTADGRLFERLAWRKKVTEPELIKTIISFWYHFGRSCYTELTIEEVAAQKGIRQGIQQIDPTIVVIPSRPDKDKARRLISVSRYFEYGLISLKTEGLVQEVLNFPHGDKDRVDAMVYAIRLFENHWQTSGSNYVRERPIDNVDKLSHNETELYLERCDAGIPGHSPPESLVKARNEAMLIAALMEEMI